MRRTKRLALLAGGSATVLLTQPVLGTADAHQDRSSEAFGGREGSESAGVEDSQDPLADDLRFRALMGLSTERSVVLEARAREDVSNSVVPFALTPEEEAEVASQLELQSALADATGQVEAVAGPGYAGLWIDQAHGGEVTVKVKDLTTQTEVRIKSLLEQFPKVTVESVRYSKADIEAASAQLSASLEALKSSGVEPLSWGFDVKSNSLVVSVERSDESVDVEEVLTRALGNVAIDVRLTGRSLNRAVTAGLGMRKVGGSVDDCTSNVLVRQNGGPIRAMTAGHCEMPSAPGLSGQNWKINGTVYGQAVKNGYANNSQADILLIARSGSYNNCVKKSNGTCVPVTGTSPSPVGAVVMSQGITTGLTSGTISASSGVSSNRGNGVILKNLAKTSNVTCRGDSGAPIYEYLSGAATARIAGVLSGGPQGAGLPVGCGPTEYSPWANLAALGIFPE